MIKTKTIRLLVTLKTVCEVFCGQNTQILRKLIPYSIMEVTL